MKSDPLIYQRTFAAMSHYHLMNPDRKIKGLIIFLKKSSDPKTLPWHSFSQACGEGFRVVYLDKALKDLPDDDPLKATFQPMLASDQNAIIENASKNLAVIRKASLESQQRDALEDVFFSFLTQHFKHLTKKELRAMIDLVPVEETVFYKEVFEEGQLKERVEKIDSTVSSFQRLLADGHISRSIYDAEVQPLLEERHLAVERLREID